MTQFAASGIDCWLTRVNKIKSSLNVNINSFLSKQVASNCIKKQVNGKFQFSWLKSIQQIRINKDGRDENKLRVYKTFKGSFTEEPYISQPVNRNQRCALTRMRISAHHLQIELGRYSNPPTPPSERYCKYCYTEPRSVDSEVHFLFECATFKFKRLCFLGKLSSLGVKVQESWPDNIKLAKVLCPTSSQATKVVNKYIDIMEKSRKLLDEGFPLDHLGYNNPPIVEGDYDPEDSDHSLSLDSVSSSFLDSSFDT